MTVDKQILAHCATGKYPIVERDDAHKFIFTPLKGEFGNYRFSGWWKTQREAENCIGSYGGYTPKNMKKYSQEQNWRIVGFYEPEYERFKVGDKVKVVGTGKLKVIIKAEDDCNIQYQTDDFNWYGHDELILHFDEEEMVDISIGDKKGRISKKSAEELSKMLNE